MNIRWGASALVVISAVVVQSAGFDQAEIFGRGRLDLPLLLVVGIGFVARADEAAILGFGVGLLVDLTQFGPFGLHALVYCLAGWALAETRIRMLEAGASFRTVQGAGAVALVTAVTWFAGGIFGQDPPRGSDWLVRLALSALLGAVLVHPVARVAQWMVGPRSAAGDG